MESSVFIDKTTPLLGHNIGEYELLNDDDDNSWMSNQSRDKSGFLFQGDQVPMEESRTYSLECALDDVYRYFWCRGFNRFLSLEIGQMVTWTWLVLFCVFLGTCIDYAGIMTVKTETSLWTFVDINNFGRNWFFILSLVLYGLYFSWRCIKLVRDVKRMWNIRNFYRVTLKIDDFDLRTIRWSDVVQKLSNTAEVLHTLNIELDDADNDRDVELGQVGEGDKSVLTRETIAARIVAKENWFKKLLDAGLADFVFRFEWKSFKTEVCMLTRGLQWNLMYCVINFFFGSDLRLRNEYKKASEINKLHFTDQLRRRILIISVINIVLTPFLVVFVALYALFRYGEEFYKDPGHLTSRQWSLAARWYFRNDNEMPHVLDERLRLSTKFASRYTEQFSSGFMEGIAKATAFVLGSFVMWMFILSFLNEQTLLMLTVSPHKTLLWFITLFSGAWVLCRSMVKDKHIFYPKEALEVVSTLVYRLPDHFTESAGSAQVLSQFQHLFPLRLTLLLMEFAGVIVTPWILLYRIRPKAKEIVDLFCENGVDLRVSNSNGAKEDFDTAMLSSAIIVENIRKLEGREFN